MLPKDPAATPQQQPVDVRCPTCKRLLFKVDMPLGVSTVKINIRCPRCDKVLDWPNHQTAQGV